VTGERERPAGQGQGEQDTMGKSSSPSIVHLFDGNVKRLAANGPSAGRTIHLPVAGPLAQLMDGERCRLR